MAIPLGEPPGRQGGVVLAQIGCGDQLTIADYLGICIVTLGEVTRFDYSPWKNVSRWIATMKARPTWGKVNEGFYAGYVAPYKDTSFVGL